MRKTTFMWLMLAALAGAVLFRTSQKVTDGHAQLAQITQNIREEEESIRVLRAEWSYLNQPARLEKLSGQYLHLQPMTGRQMVKPADLPQRPPPVTVAAADEATPPPLPASATAPPAKPAHAAENFTPPKKLPVKPVIVFKHEASLPVLKQPAPQDAPTKDARSFGDVMKSLGAQQGASRGAR
ncbi:MAG: hypothetical protein GC185_01405 [Alphaproteobacteria bacterium]|nr:hypothetical protein [Alphaproteobacteria bacterium]